MSKRLFHICTLVNDASDYAQMRRSFEAAGFTPVICRYTAFDNTHGNQYEPYSCINGALASTTEPYLIFCHQDIRLGPGSTFDGLMRAVAELDDLDENWAVAGNAGADERQCLVLHLDDPSGSWRSDRLPRRVFTLDENFLVLRVGGAARCSALAGFHLYGTDLCLNAHLRGGHCYIIDFLVTHLSAGSPWTPSFCSALSGFCRKWHQYFSVALVRSPVTEVVLSRHAPIRRLARLPVVRNAIIEERCTLVPFFTAPQLSRLIRRVGQSCWSWTRGRLPAPSQKRVARGTPSGGIASVPAPTEGEASRRAAPAATERPDGAPTVTVIMTAYKHSDYIIDSLESALAQTYRDQEVIVINDGSPDETASLLAPYVSSGRIRYIEQANAGQAAARNRALAAARGRYIAFLDDDDLWPPAKLQWQTEILERHREIVAVGGGVELIDGEGKNIGEVPAKSEDVTVARLFRGSPFWSPGQTLIRTGVLRQLGGLNERIWGADDFDLWFRLAAVGRLVALPNLSLFYRLHDGNASKNVLKMFHSTLVVLEKYLREQPAERRGRLSRDAFRYLYAFGGRPLLGRLRSDLQGLRPRAAFSALREISVLAGPALADRELLCQIGRDVRRAIAGRSTQSFSF